MKSKLFALTIVLMLMVSPFTHMVFAEETDPESPDGGEGGELGDTGDLNETDEYAPMDPAVLACLRNETQNMYMRLLQYFGNSTLSPAIMENFRHGQDAVVEGDSKNNTRAAAQMYLRAMKQYRNALRMYIHDNPETADDFEPGNATEPEEDLNVSSTEEMEAYRVQLIQRFQEQFRERITIMYANLDNMTCNLTDGDALRARNTIRKAEEKLLRIQERINLGQYDEALDDLENATDSMDEGFGGMNNTYAGQMLRTINKLEAKVQRFVEKQERKAARGEDTSDLDGIIEGLRGSINSNKNEFKENQGRGQDNDNGHGKPEDKGKPNKDKGNK